MTLDEILGQLWDMSRSRSKKSREEFFDAGKNLCYQICEGTIEEAFSAGVRTKAAMAIRLQNGELIKGGE